MIRDRTDDFTSLMGSVSVAHSENDSILEFLYSLYISFLFFLFIFSKSTDPGICTKKTKLADGSGSR